MARKKKKQRNPIAKDLITNPLYRKKVIKSKKLYNRDINSLRKVLETEP